MTATARNFETTLARSGIDKFHVENGSSDIPSIMISACGRVITSSNFSGRSACAVVGVRDGKANFPSPNTAKRVAEAFAHLASLTGIGACVTLIVGQSQCAGLPLIVRVRTERPDGDPVAIISLIDLNERRHLPEALLRATFGLTPAEATLASAIADGQSVQEIALRTRVRMPTLRSQVASILAKTGTSRQANLVCLLGRMLILGIGEG